MTRHYLRTTDLSRAVGIHPNTVRLYETWGFLPPIPRSPKGYRQFDETHLEQLRHWERNGLITIPRNPENGYRCYGPAEIGRLRVIRLLLRAGYSTMAMLRMLLQLDQGRRSGPREALDTPRPDEDILFTADRWLSTRAEVSEVSQG